MSEEDTFRALKKPTFPEMHDLWESKQPWSHKSFEEIVAFFHSHGWKYNDFLDDYVLYKMK